MFSLLDTVFFVRLPASSVQTRSRGCGGTFDSGTARSSGRGSTTPPTRRPRARFRGRPKLPCTGAPIESRLPRAMIHRWRRSRRRAPPTFVYSACALCGAEWYTDDEDALESSAPVVVVSDAFWQRELGGDMRAVGRIIKLGTQQYTVIGITPPGFTGIDLDAVDVWRPLASLATAFRSQKEPWYRNPNVNGFQVIFRPAGGTRPAELEQRLTARLRVGTRLAADTNGISETRFDQPRTRSRRDGRERTGRDPVGRCGHHRADHRLRQRHQLAARAGGSSPAGDRDSSVAWRREKPIGPHAGDRERASRGDRGASPRWRRRGGEARCCVVFSCPRYTGRARPSSGG